MLTREHAPLFYRAWLSQRFLMDALAAFGISVRSSGVAPDIVAEWHGTRFHMRVSADLSCSPDELRAAAQIHVCNVYHDLPTAEQCAAMQAQRAAHGPTEQPFSSEDESVEWKQ